MDPKHLGYYATHQSKPYSSLQQLITYSFNDEVKSIFGYIEEKGNLIFLYEYRGKYIGTEFFISFAKSSVSYQLISITEAALPEEIIN